MFLPFIKKPKSLAYLITLIAASILNLILNLLTNQKRIWMILFPEGTRSPDGKIHEFKRGISIFSEKTQTPILFLYLDGNTKLWPKGSPWAKPGKLTIHIGPVSEPGPIDEVYQKYKEWVKSINPKAFADDNSSAETKP